jgi:hypothetical protein
LSVQVSGRQKHGAVRVEPDSVLCEVTMSDGTVYPVYRYGLCHLDQGFPAGMDGCACSGVGGTVMELNQRIVETPCLLQSSVRNPCILVCPMIQDGIVCLTSQPEVRGYVAMMRPLTPEAVVDLTSHMLSYEQYRSLRSTVSSVATVTE